MQPTIYFASDHAGFRLKNDLLEYVRDTLGYEVHDCGAHTYDEQDDYTDFIAIAAREVSAHKDAKAVILGGSGQGEAMLANRFHDVRAAVFYGGDQKIITLSREHNDANVLSLGARFLDTEEAKEAVALWLSTSHADEAKYDRRIDEMEAFSSAQRNVLPKKNIVPSLPAQSYDEIEKICTLLRNVSSGLQIDIVDNVFVPHTSWPFTQADPKSELVKLTQWSSQFEIEIDCMCMDPLQYLDLFVEIGVKRVVIHAGSTEEYAACIAHAREHKYAIGIAVTNDTDLQVLNTLSSSIDFIQVMGIANIGQQGQEFDERTLDTVAKLRKIHPYLEIAVDGAVNQRTIPHLLQAGATRFAPGSAVAQASDPVSAYTQLATLIQV